MADSINNKQENKEMEKYYEEKDKVFKTKLLEIEKKLKKLNVENYSYENTCLMNFTYNLILIFTGLHILCNFGISATWVILGISSLLKNFGFIEDGEKKYYKEMMEKANQVYDQMHQHSKEIPIEPEETTPLNVNIKKN